MRHFQSGDGLAAKRAFDAIGRGDKNSLASTTDSPTQWLRTPSDFIRFEGVLKRRKYPIKLETLTRHELEKEKPGLGIHPDPKTPWLKTDGTTLGANELVTFVKAMKLPPKGVIHPQEPTVDDGTVVAVFPTALERKIRAGKKPLGEKYAADDYGALMGNQAAFGKGAARNAAGRVNHRYRSMFKGAGEGFSDPRFMGKIMCNLGLTSVAISSLLYSVLYFSDYAETQHSLHHEKLRQLQQQQLVLANQANGNGMTLSA